MSRQDNFTLAFYDEATDEMIGPRVRSPFLPPAGTVLIISDMAQDPRGFCFEVVKAHVVFPAYGSPSYRDNEPLMCDVIVRPHEGIHR